MKKAILFVFIFLVVASAGLTWGIYNYASRHNLSASETVDILMIGLDFQTKGHVSPPKPPKPPEPEKPPEPPEVVKPPEPPPPPPEPVEPKMPLSVAREIIDKAMNEYKQLEFQSAATELDKVLKEKPSPELTQNAVDLNRKCVTFSELIKPVKPEEMTDLTGMVQIKLTNGQTIIGKLVKEEKRSIRIKQYGIERTISGISRYRKLTPEDYKTNLRAEYEKQLSRLKKPSALDYHKLALYCYKNRLADETLAMLELALEKDENILETLRNKESPKPTEVTKPSEETPEPEEPSEPEEPPEPEKPPEPVSSPEIEKQLAQAEKYYQKGKNHLDFAESNKTSPRFNKEARNARKAFKDALAIYQKIQKTRPDDLELEVLIGDIQNLLIHIRKDLGVSHE